MSSEVDTDVVSSVDSAEDVSEDTSDQAESILFTWEIRIDGVDYILPFDFSEIASHGYGIEDERDVELGKRSFAVFSPTLNRRRRDIRLNVQFWNPTDTPKMLTECKIGQISVRADSNYEFILPGGLVFDQTVTVPDILDMYGKPQKLVKQDEYTSVHYEQSAYSTVDFIIYTKDDSKFNLNEVTLQNFV